MCYALRGVRADRVLIGAWNPMLLQIRGFRRRQDDVRRRYVTFHPNFHHFDRFERDLRGHTQVRGATFSCPRLKTADMVLI